MKNSRSQVVAFKCVLSFCYSDDLFCVRSIPLPRVDFFAENFFIVVHQPPNLTDVVSCSECLFSFRLLFCFLFLLLLLFAHWLPCEFSCYFDYMRYLNSFIFAMASRWRLFLSLVRCPIGENKLSCRKLQMHENASLLDEWVQFFERWTIFSVTQNSKWFLQKNFFPFDTTRYTIDNNIWFTWLEFFLSISQFDFILSLSIFFSVGKCELLRKVFVWFSCNKNDFVSVGLCTSAFVVCLFRQRAIHHRRVSVSLTATRPVSFALNARCERA